MQSARPITCAHPIHYPLNNLVGAWTRSQENRATFICEVYFKQSGRKSSSGVNVRNNTLYVGFSYQKHAARLHASLACPFCLTSGPIRSPLVINKFSSTWFSHNTIQHLLPYMPLILFQKQPMTICKDSTNYTGNGTICQADGSGG
jgi:hypothetical protein